MRDPLVLDCCGAATGCATEDPAAALINFPKPNALAGLTFNVAPTTVMAVIAGKSLIVFGSERRSSLLDLFTIS